MNEKLLEALDEISDHHIAQAAKQKTRHTRLYLRGIAAILALVLLLLLLRPEPTPVAATELVSPAAYTPVALPSEDDYEDYTAYHQAIDAYLAELEPRSDAVDEALAHLRPFWSESLRELTVADRNNIWSPINLYMSLAMLAQTASGTTRQEILDALGTPSIEALRTETKALWETIRRDKEGSQRLLANSLWLDQDLTYDQENLQILGTDFYASVHRTELDSSAADTDIQAWIDRQTFGLLEGTDPTPTPGHLLSQRVLSLVSTLYVEASWDETFDTKYNTEDTFHAPKRDITCTYLNGMKEMAYYYDGDGFSTVGLSTTSGCILWLTLPDEDSNVNEVLKNGGHLTPALDMTAADYERCRVSMPKFDLASSQDMVSSLKTLGIREAFSPFGGDFSGTLSLPGPIYADSLTQSARIIVDETGIRAASASRIEVLSKGQPDNPIEFTLDRPFLFVLTLRNIPLFAGVVTDP